jgi:MFS family permease
MFGLLVERFGFFERFGLPFGVSVGIGAFAFLLSFAVRSRRVAAKPPTWRAFAQTLRRPRLPLVGGLLFLAFFGYGLLLGHLMPEIQERFRHENLSYLASIYFVSGLLFTYLGGYLSDRWGRWPVLLGSYACGGFSMVLMTGFSPEMSPWTLAAALALLAIPFGAVPVTAMAWIGDVADERDRPIVYASAFMWRDLGAATAALAAVWLGRPRNLAPGFWLMSAVFFLPALAGAVKLMFRNPQGGSPNRS